MTDFICMINEFRLTKIEIICVFVKQNGSFGSRVVFLCFDIQKRIPSVWKENTLPVQTRGLG